MSDLSFSSDSPPHDQVWTCPSSYPMLAIPVRHTHHYFQVFCFPCVLHYLSTSENTKWARCPICFDSINEKQLKGVHWFDPPSHLGDGPDGAGPQPSSSSAFADIGPMKTPKPGSTLRMRLMQRPPITTLALPRTPTWPSDLLPPHQAPFHFLPDVYTYAKFMLATPSYLIDNLTRDLSELASERHALLEFSDELGIIFCDAAEQKLNSQIAKANALGTDALHAAIDRALQLEHEIAARAALHAQRKQERESTATPDPSNVPTHYLSTQASSTPPPSSTPTSRSPKLRKNLNPPPPSTSAYYFYQAASGLPIFLHPLDIKILSSHFGAYAAFPDSIVVRVEAASEGSVDADLRRRCKYLSHIPEGADVVFVEADVEGVVGAEGLRAFEGAIKARRARRREKGRRDEKARVRAEERERKKLVVTGVGADTPSRITTTGNSPAWGTGELEFEPEQDWNASSRAASPSPSPASRTQQQQQQQQQQSGAWGSRSFAAAANSGRGGVTAEAATRVERRPQRRYDSEDADADEWAFELDLERAWHELEGQRGSGGGAGAGGRKRRARMVVLGGGGGPHGTGRRR